MRNRLLSILMTAVLTVVMAGNALAATVNKEFPQYANDYDPEVPLKNYIDAFGLRLMPVTPKMIEYGASPWTVTSKENDYEKLLEGLPVDNTTWAGLNAGSGSIANEWVLLTGQMEFYISGHDNPYGTEQQRIEVASAIKEFLNSFDWRNATEQERAVAAAKWVCQAEYDQYAVENKKEEFSNGAWGYYGALVKKKAVCNGLVAGYGLLCRAVGLKETAWGGRSIDHVSNQVYIDGTWYHFDPTNYAGHPSDWIRFVSSFHLLGECSDCWAD